MSVIHSIVLSLGMARILGALAGVARHWSHLKDIWFFLGWLALLLALHLGWWFGLWARFHGINEIELTTFVLWFMVPASFYVASRLLIPDFPEKSPPNLEQRFADVRIPFFGCFVLAILPVLPSLADAQGPQWIFPVVGVLGLSGMVVSNRRWHVAVLVLMLAGYIAFLALVRSSIIA